MPFGALLPKEHSFFDFFESHSVKCLEGATLLHQLMEDVSHAKPLAKRIKETEHDGDKITHQTVETLHKTFITPIDREEIHQLISRMDDILDFIEAVSERIVLYEIKEIPPEAKELTEVLVHACEQVREALIGLRTLKFPMEILKACVEINRLENEGDAVLRKALARLFKESKDAIQVIMWKDIFESLEAATDRCEDVANIIEGVVLEHG